MKTTMSGIPKGSITKFYPGTFDARSTYSFQVLFTEIRFRVEERMFRGSEEQYIPIPAVDIVDLLSGHFAPVEFLAPTGVKQLKFIRLKNISFIHDEIRLLLSDMGFGSETPYVIDRLSQMALGWDQLVFRFNESSAMVISPRATKGLFVHNQNPDFFVSVEDADTVDAEDGAPTTFGDVIVEIDTAAQYAFKRATFEPEIPSLFPYVLRVRFGLRVLTRGIDEKEAAVFDHSPRRVFDICNETLGRFLVPGLYDGR